MRGVVTGVRFFVGARVRPVACTAFDRDARSVASALDARNLARFAGRRDPPAHDEPRVTSHEPRRCARGAATVGAGARARSRFPSLDATSRSRETRAPRTGSRRARLARGTSAGSAARPGRPALLGPTRAGGPRPTSHGRTSSRRTRSRRGAALACNRLVARVALTTTRNSGHDRRQRQEHGFLEEAHSNTLHRRSSDRSPNAGVRGNIDASLVSKLEYPKGPSWQVSP